MIDKEKKIEQLKELDKVMDEIVKKVYEEKNLHFKQHLAIISIWKNSYFTRLFYSWAGGVVLAKKHTTIYPLIQSPQQATIR